MPQSDDCCVCLEKYSSEKFPVNLTSCTHSLCFDCMVACSKTTRQFQCPQCRQPSNYFSLDDGSEPIPIPMPDLPSTNQRNISNFESWLHDVEFVLTRAISDGLSIGSETTDDDDDDDDEADETGEENVHFEPMISLVEEIDYNIANLFNNFLCVEQ